MHAEQPRPHAVPAAGQVPRLLLCHRHARLLSPQVPEAQRCLLLVQTVRGTGIHWVENIFYFDIIVIYDPGLVMFDK